MADFSNICDAPIDISSEDEEKVKVEGEPQTLHISDRVMSATTSAYSLQSSRCRNVNVGAQHSLSGLSGNCTYYASHGITSHVASTQDNSREKFAVKEEVNCASYGALHSFQAHGLSRQNNRCLLNNSLNKVNVQVHIHIYDRGPSAINSSEEGSQITSPEVLENSTKRDMVAKESDVSVDEPFASSENFRVVGGSETRTCENSASHFLSRGAVVQASDNCRSSLEFRKQNEQSEVVSDEKINDTVEDDLVDVSDRNAKDSDEAEHMPDEPLQQHLDHTRNTNIDNAKDNTTYGTYHCLPCQRRFRNRKSLKEHAIICSYLVKNSGQSYAAHAQSQQDHTVDMTSKCVSGQNVSIACKRSDKTDVTFSVKSSTSGLNVRGLRSGQVAVPTGDTDTSQKKNPVVKRNRVRNSQTGTRKSEINVVKAKQNRLCRVTRFPARGNGLRLELNNKQRPREEVSDAPVTKRVPEQTSDGSISQDVHRRAENKSKNPNSDVNISVLHKRGRPTKRVRLQQTERSRFVCRYCSKHCQSTSEKDVHERTHTDHRSAGNLEKSCEICLKVFTSKQQLTIHMKTHSRERSSSQQNVVKRKRTCIEKKPYSCKFCSKSFKCKHSTVLHERIHTGEKPFSCKFCSKSFRYKHYVGIHERIHTGEKPFSCKFCSKTFQLKSKVVRHERIHTGEKPFSCKFCSKTFREKSKVVQHERIHTGEKPFSCKFCSKSFRHKSNAVTHERIHTGEKQFSCKFCSKTFRDKSKVVQHERIHTGEKPFSCKFCSKTFREKSKVVQHERIHTGEKPFSCKFCSKSFRHKSNAVTHERIHTGEKQFSCKFCSKTFPVKQRAVLHERIHTGEKPFSCKFCPKSFSYKHNVHVHERIHTGEKPFSCKFCSKSFSQMQSAVAHERIHTGVKAFSCKICSRFFRLKQEAVKHERIHAKEKPFSCKFCCKTFNEKEKAVLHERTHI